MGGAVPGSLLVRAESTERGGVAPIFQGSQRDRCPRVWPCPSSKPPAGSPSNSKAQASVSRRDAEGGGNRLLPGAQAPGLSGRRVGPAPRLCKWLRHPALQGLVPWVGGLTSVKTEVGKRGAPQHPVKG